jgi:hypothetical protein
MVLASVPVVDVVTAGVDIGSAVHDAPCRRRVEGRHANGRRLRGP